MLYNSLTKYISQLLKRSCELEFSKDPILSELLNIPHLKSFPHIQLPSYIKKT